MFFFKSKAEKELDGIIRDMDLYLQNNYKDPAHECRKKLARRCEELHSVGKLDDEKYDSYMSIYNKYTVMLKDYHH